ncbi:MAG TPA: SDR family NAD(P)-dependent oxidoreductase [Solirubrobacterales bacterium]|nr:SDR family NAD(P)-dependent oxidoreductase [Solirubrobacterales bacterium]
MAVSSEQIEKALRTSLKEAERLRQQNQQLLGRQSEPIAIVGMSCRYPGGAGSPQGLWELLAAGGSAIGDFPDDRGWELEGLYDLSPEQAEAGFAYRGGFLDEGIEFDPAFFGISPREALAMDPQQRLLLEGAWEALEDAGIDPTALRGTDTGVFAGISPNSYLLGGSREDPAIVELKGHVGTGFSPSVASGRVAYTLGLEGPAVSIDTACSSSLVAIHLAAQALRGGECALALAGGVAGIANPELFVEFFNQGGLAPDGQCKSFSATADGAGFSEGVGLLLLERLSDAKRNGRRILAVVRGSATNQDGASNGLTAPNGPSQERVIRAALANAGIEPSEVDAVEAHGTGTALGDPIEGQALLATYGRERPAPLALGSLKSNLGHTQAAAGVGGVIKMVMALREEALPKTLHAEEPSPHVDWSAGEIELLTEARPWSRGERPRRAGVSSFGVSGTNAHVIIEEPPAAPAPDRATAARPPLLPWVLSAKSPEALAAAAARLAAHVEAEDPDLADVAHTLLHARARLEHRAVVVGADRAELLAGLAALAQGRPAPNLVSARAGSRSKVAFVFPGHGNQWLGMARDLLDESPQFAASIERCDRAFAPYREVGIAELIRRDDPAWLEETPLLQPVTFSVMVALAELWQAYGVQPGAFVGHSQGEVAAAVVAGAISLEDGALITAQRSVMLPKLTGTGSLVAAGIPAAQAAALIERFEGEVTVAAINGPTAVLLATPYHHVDELLAELEAAGARRKVVATTVAAHSPHIEVLREESLRLFAPVTPRQTAASFYSTVSAEPIPTERLDAEYWFGNMRRPVRFHEAVQALLRDGYSALIETSSHPVLAMALQETAEAEDRGSVAVLHSLRRDEGGMRRMLTSLADAHVHGVAVDFSPLLGGSGATLTELPTYPFQRRRLWVDRAAGAGNVPSLGQRAAAHPLLGAAIAVAGEDGHLLTGRVSLRTHPWLADHGIADTPILPGTGFVELALRAGREVGAEQLRELVLEAPLPIPAEGALQLQVSLTPREEEGVYGVAVHARPEPEGAAEGEDPGAAPWTRHASGTLAAELPPAQDLDALAWPPPGAEPIETEAFYDTIAAAGFEYGPAFQGLEAAWKLGDHAYAEIALAPEQEKEAERFGVHPALLDAALHAAFFCIDADAGGGAMLPFAFNGVSLYGARGAASLRVRVSVEGEKIHLDAADGEGNPVASIRSVAARPVDPAQFGAPPAEDALLSLRWSELELPEAPADAPAVAVFECVPDPAAGAVAATHALCAEVLERLQAFLADAAPEERLAFVTAGAVAAADGESPDPAAGAVWGLVRSAESEHPGRFVLVDTDGSEASRAALPAALGVTEEPQLALREGAAMVPRLVRAAESEELAPPAEPGPWHLEKGEGGVLEDLRLVPAPQAQRPLQGSDVRLAVHAAGVNFRDVLLALGMYPGVAAASGGEGAGVVLEVGPEVADLRPGDRVFGLVPDAFGPVAISDRSLLAPMPREWSFEQGASVTTVFATAYYGLVDLAELKAGERVLIHAGAGGVGMAAIQLAQHLGAEVFATASPSKWGALRDLGLDDDHIASSRDLGFEEKFLATTGGEGVDVVLDALVREFVDASLRLLPRGGRFLEMGKTDVRDPDQVAADHPGVEYRAFDLGEAGPERVQAILGELLDLFAQGELRRSPIASWDVREAKRAFRHLSGARHVGKVVLRIPQPSSAAGTALVTGGLSGVGALTARHLARRGVTRLLLVSRRGPDAPGADELLAELAELGCEAEAVACDVSDRSQVETLLDSVPAEHPLSAVYHSAAVLADGTIETLDRERLDAVLAAKADAAWHLHEATAEMELSDFALYSSIAGSFGSPGQGNYAAANAFLDALAQRRHAEGRPATAVAWGLWAQTSSLDETADRDRLAGFGLVPIEAAEGVELLDRARLRAEPFAVAAPLQAATMRAAAGAGMLPSLLTGLFTVNRRRARAASGSLARRLATVPKGERGEIVLTVVREHAAAILGHGSPKAIDPGANFKDLGFDSLGAVEMRNRLAQATGVQLDATVVFDRPTPEAIAAYLLEQVEGKVGGGVVVHAARGSAEPVAIVGMSCRFPGGVASPEGLWRLLGAGEDAISTFPGDRGWEIERFYDPDPERPGKTYARGGGFLAGAGEFDPAFFGISPREALAMDPQQRLLLEDSWQVLEDAGIDPLSLRGSSTGVFVGMTAASYLVGAGAEDAGDLEGYLITGLSPSVASGRLAYTLGLEGPALTVDTACSSSLVALHLAAQALQGGECELALAGGATVIGDPAILAGMSRQRVLAPDGRCKSFDGGADGIGVGEGSGLLLLERLSDAKRNGRRILAVIKGSATNQDGASNGLTAPNGPSQERVIRQALANAGLKPSEVDAVEAHGTGTTLGDPIEAGALLATYGQDRETPLQLGSLKSNIGHTQAAAGAGGVIKMVMALREEALPKTLHVSEPTPHVDWSAGEIELLTEQREWPKGGRPRRAGISSFGISGTNAHLIIEEAPEQPAPGKTKEAPPLLPFALSAKTPEALSDAAGKLAAHLEAEGPDPLDVAHTLINARAQLEQRAVIVAADQAELLLGLDALARGKSAESLVQAKKAQGPVAFLLSGQGSQRAQMGKGLYEAFPVYAEAFDSACDALASEGIEVKEAIWAQAGTELSESLERTDLTQASLFALQVSLFALVGSFGLSPDYLLGHSVGEITAAHLAGVFSLQDAARLIAARGRLMAALPEGGAMAFITATEAEVEAGLASYEGRLTIAAVNSPTQITVSGDEDALAEWEAELGKTGKEAKRLRVSHAFHSHRMELMLEEFEEVAATLSTSAPKLPVISNRTGEPLTPEQAADPAYWAGQVRGEVRFADGLAYLQDQGTAAYLELGPAAVLSALAAQESPATATATALRHKRDDARSLLLALGNMHAAGQRVDFEQLFKGTGARTTKLPTYPFQRERYWVEATRSTGDLSAAGQSSTEHPLLGAAVSLADGSHLLTGRISQKTHPWLAEHAVAGTAILPGSAFVELALRAGQEVGTTHLQELILEAPLPISEEGAVQLQVTVSGEHELTVHARQEPTGDEEETPWARHATATLSDEPPAPLDFDAIAWPPAGAEPLDTADLYERVADMGLEYGPAFQGLEAAWRLGEEIYAEISLAEEQSTEAGSFGVHPALLDAALHAAGLDPDAADTARQPSTFSGVSVHIAKGPSALRIRLSGTSETVRLEAADAEGNPVAALDAGLGEVDIATIGAATQGDALFATRWRELEPAGPLKSPPDLLSPMRNKGPADFAGGEAEIFRCVADPDLDPAAASHALCAEVLERLQQAIAGEEPTRLAFLTEGAVALDPGESPDPALAAVWGLVRSAQSEHPGRFLLIDSDGSDASEQALAMALAQTEEPQLALREGTAWVPRLARAETADRGSGEAPADELDPDGTVLLTGGLSGLGALTAKHLAEQGAKHLLLSSRRGPDAPGAQDLIAELAALDCVAEAVACDVSDRAEVEALIASVPKQHPLTAVIHSAGVIDDGVIDSLDAPRLDAVLAPKADAAWHLHEATRGMDLAAFVLYSSSAATFGAPGQGNYAAANSFLDALAARRRAEGLPATAIAWGMWEEGMAAGLSDAQRGRATGVGLIPIEPARGFALLERARALPDPAVAAVPFDARVVRTAARAGLLPPLLSELVRLPARRARAGGAALAEPLAGVPAEGREATVLALVSEQIAAVLGHSGAAAIDPDRNLLELGFDSLGAVELRNRLSNLAGTQLPATVALEHPTPRALAAHLLARFEESAPGGPAAPAAEGSTLRALVDSAHAEGRTAEVAASLIEMSKFHPSFATAAELGQPPEAVTIAAEGAGPRLICLPSFVVGSGPHQFARLARALDGRHPLTALALPGFRPGERFPASWDAAIEALAGAATEAAAGDPFVLAGFSSGGGLAHAVAERLEAEGAGPAAVVLIDSYLLPDDAVTEGFATVLAQMLDRDHEAIAIDDDNLLAMAAYIRLFRGWRPGELAAPSLMLRAAEALGEPGSEGDRAAWSTTETVEVASDHFGTVADAAPLSAAAIEAWLGALPTALAAEGAGA